MKLHLWGFEKVDARSTCDKLEPTTPRVQPSEYGKRVDVRPAEAVPLAIHRPCRIGSPCSESLTLGPIRWAQGERAQDVKVDRRACEEVAGGKVWGEGRRFAVDVVTRRGQTQFAICQWNPGLSRTASKILGFVASTNL